MPTSPHTFSAHVFTVDVAVDTAATTPAAMSLSSSTKTTPVVATKATSQTFNPEETMSDITPSLSIDGHKQFNKVVCIDRDKQASRELRAALESLKYEVAACASDAFEAVRIVTMHDPDVVMVDVHLQEPFDGLALAQYLQENFRAAIVFVASDTKTSTLERALELHPQGFLNKPYRPLDVRNALALARQYSQMRQPFKAERHEHSVQEGSVQGRLEKIGGALPALQLLTLITPHGKLVFDDGAEIVVSEGDVVDVQHPSRKQHSKQVLDDIIRRQQGCFRVEALESAPKRSFRASVNGLLLQYQLDADDIDRTLYDLRMLSLEAVDPYKHPSQFRESDSLIIETLSGDDELHIL
jgi:CheY-like chemotaxis protein